MKIKSYFLVLFYFELESGVFADHICKNKRKTNTSTIFVRCFVRVFLYTQTAVDAGDMHLTNHGYFDYGLPEDP